MSHAQPKLTWRETRRLIGLDLDQYAVWPRAFGAIPANRPRWWQFLYIFFTTHMFAAVLIYRLQTFMFDSRLSNLATVLSRLNHLLFSVTIGHHVRTTGALYIAHGHVVMDGTIKLGHGVEVAPFVTLGLSNSSDQSFGLEGPTIGDRVNIGTGAKILGPVTIGDDVKIGANAVVVKDIPANHSAMGVPAKNYPRRPERDSDQADVDAN